MQNILYGIFRVTLGMSVIILLMMLILRITGKKFTVTCRYIIWIVIILRLAIPVGLNAVPALFEIPVNVGSLDATINATDPNINSGTANNNSDNGAGNSEIGTNAFVEDKAPVLQDNMSDSRPETSDGAIHPDSLSPSVPHGTLNTHTPIVPEINVPEFDIPEVDTPMPDIPGSENIEVKPSPVIPSVPEHSTDINTNTEDRTQITWQSTVYGLSVIYLVGACGFILFNSISYLLYIRRLVSSSEKPDSRIVAIYTDICREKKLHRIPELLCSDKIGSPLAFGLFRRRIFIPAINFSDSSIKNTLTHEVIHCKRGDLYIKALILIARALHWFNPLVHIAAYKCESAMELSCDETVLKGCGEDDRVAYGETMLDIVRSCRRSGGTLTTHFNPKKKAVKARLSNIICGAGKSRGRIIISVCLLLSIFASTLVACSVIEDNPDNGKSNEADRNEYTNSILLTLSDYDYTEALLSDEDVISTNTKSEGIVLFGHNAKQVRKTFSQGDGEKNRGFEFYDADTDELFFAAISSKLMIADTVDGQNDVIISEYNNNGTTHYELYYSTGDGIKKADLSKDITKAIPVDAYDLKLNSKNCFIYSTPGEYKDGKIFTYCCFDLSYDGVMIYDTWDITEEPYSKFESNTDGWYTEIKDHEDGYGQIISVFGPDGKHFAYSNSDLRFRIDDYIISRDLIIHPTQKYAALIYNGHDTYRWCACTTCTVISLETGEIISLDDSIALEDMREVHFSPKGPVNYSADTLDEFVAEERNSIFPAHRIRHFVSITEDGFDIKVAGTDIEGNIILDNIYRYAVPARENGITAGCAPEHGFEPQDSALSELAISACKGKIPHEEFLADSDAQKFIAENLSLIVEKELSTDDFDVYVVAPDAMYPMTVVLSECDEYNTLLSFRLTDYGHFVYSLPYKLYGKYEEDRLIAAYSPECIYINKNDLSRAIEESTDIDTKTVEYRGLYMSSEEERKVTVPIFSGAELYIAVLYIENDLTYSLKSCEKTDPRSLSAKDFFISHKAFGFKPIDLINNDRGIPLSPEKEITAVLGSAVIPEGTNIYSSFGDHPHTLPTISITTTDETVYMLRNKHTGQFISSSDIESDISLGDLEWWVRSSTDYVTDSDKHTLYIGNYTGEVKDGKANGRGKFLFGDGSTYSGEWKDGQINGYGTYLFVSGDIYTGEYINGVRNGQGTYTFTDGAVYTGTFKDGKRDGQGVFSFPNGNVYSGQFSDGNFHGSGTYSYANGDSYVGEYSNGRQNGQGIFTFADGENYVGGFSNGMYHGSGTYTHINGDVYTGEYSNGKRNGIGTSTYANGDQYTGEWKNGKREGQGTYTYASGDQYTGEWKNGKPDGQGTYTFADGAVYTGEYKDGKYNGYGKLTYDNGDVYVGWWKDDKRNGKGIYTFATGSFYNGEWKDGNYHGSGTFVYSNGNKYVGEFIDGNKNGQGTYTFANGSFYTGEWKDDKRHGQGTITYIDGNVYSGEWRDDKYYNGTLVYNNGTAYTGEWKDDKYHGSGTLTFSTGRKLSGKWENGNYISE